MYNLTCPECKNDVDLSSSGDLKEEQVIECNHCGITLQVSGVADDKTVSVDIVEEGK